MGSIVNLIFHFGILFALIAGIPYLGLVLLDDNFGPENDNIIDNNIEYNNIKLSEVEDTIVRETNAERDNRDLNNLTVDNNVVEIADYKSDNMAENNYISHTSPDGETLEDRFYQFNHNCSCFGENLARTIHQTPVQDNSGQELYFESEEELGKFIVRQLMNSDGHRDNILREDWDSISVSVSITETNRVYAVQKFCSYD